MNFIMSDYISREAMLQAYKDEQKRPGSFSFEKLINSVPAAAVKDEVIGKWEWFGPCRELNGRYWGTCSVCKERQRLGDYKNFCPNCGAYMKG